MNLEPTSTNKEMPRARECRVWSAKEGLLKTPLSIVRLVPTDRENPFKQAVAEMFSLPEDPQEATKPEAA